MEANSTVHSKSLPKSNVLGGPGVVHGAAVIPKAVHAVLSRLSAGPARFRVGRDWLRGRLILKVLKKYYIGSSPSPVLLPSRNLPLPFSLPIRSPSTHEY
ncbi:hypothetical protein PGTUg99_025224 [Puccinia graminis f. sp. tritici]|uniref:Uncharacterized protein n=1 Tax=Puccinia graminis f. sp. tritici TaxID=56615 RepID=A0A5B0LSB2_PUCGR|nr:hypothetical protein PGTUg99_025224 [Puccinia graminis f. sp. tritici]